MMQSWGETWEMENSVPCHFKHTDLTDLPDFILCVQMFTSHRGNVVDNVVGEEKTVLNTL